MTTQDFLQAVQSIAQSKPSYRLGGDGSDGTCDCIGLVIGAVKRCGGRWDGIHGSNWAARYAVEQFRDLRLCVCPGDLVFKVHQKGHPQWRLPDRYASHGDQADYYHVGVVTSVDPLTVTHCTTPGILIDTSLEDWDAAASLSLLDVPDDPAQIRTVSAPSGSTVNLRKSPGGALLTRVPVGTQVQVKSVRGDWTQLSYQGRTGWMLSQYLRGESEPTDRIALLEQAVTELRRRVAELEESS